MSKDNTRSRIYGINKMLKSAVKDQTIQGHQDLYITVQFYRKNKKLNSIEKAEPDNINKLLLSYAENENPDKIKIEIRSENSDKIHWFKAYEIESESNGSTQEDRNFQGFGEAEVAEIVKQKLDDYKFTEELNNLRKEREELLSENNKLIKEIEDLEETIEAKGGIEYYTSLIGLALPGVAKTLAKTPLGGTLGLLAGTGSEENAENFQEAQQKPKSKQQEHDETIVDLITEYLKGLDSMTLQHFYLIFIELSNNPALISQILTFITTKNTQKHDYQETN